MATIYTDLIFIRLKDDVEKWYNENYYPQGYKGSKPELEKHLTMLDVLYDPNASGSAEEIRVDILTRAQEEVNRIFMGE